MKTVIVHDWLTGLRGGEKALEAIYELYPSPVYTLVRSRDFKSTVIPDAAIRTSWLQKLPMSGRLYRSFLAWFPAAIESFDLGDYDLVLSTSSAVAKGVLTTAKQLHVCYIHSPMRYAWDLYFDYLRDSGLDRGLKGLYARSVLRKLRLWDAASANRVDRFLTNSEFVARRVRKTYRREAEVIYGPVDVDTFTLETDKENYYLTVSSLVPYKKIDLIVQAFAGLPERRLVVIGSGPDARKVAAAARGCPNVELLGFRPTGEVRDRMRKARAFIFAAEEDFGLAPLEAQACGTPVLAYAGGGALETVVDGETGLFFREQSPEAIRECVGEFERRPGGFDPTRIRRNAERFSRVEFQRRYRDFVERVYNEWRISGQR